MPDHQFSDRALAELYDLFNPWDERGDFGFYRPLVMSSEAVLDVGCGTGALLRRARDEGHTGRLCGLDPAVGMLEQARRLSNIEWILGDLGSVHWDQEFDLVVMTGHAFQVLITDDEIRTSLAGIHEALSNGGRFVFETRNPSVKAWEDWTPNKSVRIVGPDGTVVEMVNAVETPVSGDLVSFTTTFTSPTWRRPAISCSTLRFLGRESLASFLSDAHLIIEDQFGDWDRRPISETSPEIITIARRG